MIIWILMILDIAVLVITSLAHFEIFFSAAALFYSAGYLFLKFVIFREFMSGIDAAFGIYVLLVAFFHFTGFFYYLMLGWFIYKLVSTAMSLA